MPQLHAPQQSDIEAAVRRDLPGWRLCESPKRHRSAATTANAGLSIKRVGDFEQLRKKFLGPRSSGATKEVMPTPLGEAVSVRVVSSDGRLQKTADVVNGVATIVQG